LGFRGNPKNPKKGRKEIKRPFVSYLKGRITGREGGGERTKARRLDANRTKKSALSSLPKKRFSDKRDTNRTKGQPDTIEPAPHQ